MLRIVTKRREYVTFYQHTQTTENTTKRKELLTKRKHIVFENARILGQNMGMIMADKT